MFSFVINLDRSPERLAKMRAQFEKHDASFIRVNAIDGAKYDGEYLDKSHCTISDRPLTKSEIACFLSHRLCWEKIASGTDNYAAVFEDDMILSENAWGLIKNGANWLSLIDILKIETYNERLYFSRRSKRVTNRSHLKRMLSFHAGAGGYIISKQTAERLLTLTNDYLPCGLDHYLFNNDFFPRNSKKIYQLVPAISIQSRRQDGAPAEESTIQPVEVEQIIMPRPRKRLSERVYKSFGSISRFLFYKKMKIPVS